MFVGTGLGDTNAGVHAFAGIGYALFHRDRTGEGSHIDVSMVDALFHMHENNVQATSITDGEYEPMRAGRHYGPVAPAGSFEGPDGWIVLLCGVNQIANLWDALGQPELADDPRFATNDTRIEHRDALTDIIEKWMATFESNTDVLAAFEKARVPCGPVLDPAEAITHEYFVERGMIRTAEDELTGPFAIPGFPIAISGQRPDDDLRAPSLGQDNAEVLRDILGYDDETIASLTENGVLGSKPR